jgi:hypothetical protein
LSLITKTNQGPRCFQALPLHNRFDPSVTLV